MFNRELFAAHLGAYIAAINRRGYAIKDFSDQEHHPGIVNWWIARDTGAPITRQTPGY